MNADEFIRTAKQGVTSPNELELSMYLLALLCGLIRNGHKTLKQATLAAINHYPKLLIGLQIYARDNLLKISNLKLDTFKVLDAYVDCISENAPYGADIQEFLNDKLNQNNSPFDIFNNRFITVQSLDNLGEKTRDWASLISSDFANSVEDKPSSIIYYPLLKNAFDDLDITVLDADPLDEVLESIINLFCAGKLYGEDGLYKFSDRFTQILPLDNQLETIILTILAKSIKYENKVTITSADVTAQAKSKDIMLVATLLALVYQKYLTIYDTEVRFEEPPALDTLNGNLYAQVMLDAKLTERLLPVDEPALKLKPEAEFGDLTLRNGIIYCKKTELDLSPTQFRLLEAMLKRNGGLVESQELRDAYTDIDEAKADIRYGQKQAKDIMQLIYNSIISINKELKNVSNVFIKNDYSQGYRLKIKKSNPN